MAAQGMWSDGSEAGEDEGPLDSDTWAAPHGSRAAAAAGPAAAGSGAVEVRELGSPHELWSLEEAELARDALLALQARPSGGVECAAVGLLSHEPLSLAWMGTAVQSLSLTRPRLGTGTC